MHKIYKYGAAACLISAGAAFVIALGLMYSNQTDIGMTLLGLAIGLCGAAVIFRLPVLAASRVLDRSTIAGLMLLNLALGSFVIFAGLAIATNFHNKIFSLLMMMLVPGVLIAYGLLGLLSREMLVIIPVLPFLRARLRVRGTTAIFVGLIYCLIGGVMLPLIIQWFG